MALADAAPQRRLTALVHADVVGFSRLVGLDDRGTSTRLRRLRTELIRPLLDRHQGTLVNTAGDAFLMSFRSVLASVEYAVELQRRASEFDEGRIADQLIRFRVGVDLGDVLADDTDVLGHGINVAARLQAICPPGGVCISRAVHDHVRDRVSFAFAPIGLVTLKNIQHPVEAFVWEGANAILVPPSPPPVVVRQPGPARRRWRGRLMSVAAIAVIAAAAAYWARPAGPGAGDQHRTEGEAGKVSIAVLPFDNLSADAEQTYLADGISEDLTTDLARLPGATVVARESAFTYRGKQVDVREVGRQLGVQYVVEGSVRKLGDTVRVNAQLVSAVTGAHLWAERFDKPLRELEGGMGDVVVRIGAALDIKPAPGAPGHRSPAPGDPEAFDLVLRARSVLNEPWREGRNAIARGLFEQALRRDPASVPAETGVAAMLLQTRGESLHRASLLVTDAEGRAPGSPDVLSAKFLLLRGLGRWSDSVQVFRTLLDVDSSAAGVALQGNSCPQCWGDPDDAIPLLQRTAQLNPRSPNSAPLYLALGRLLLMAGRTDDAIGWLERVVNRPRDAGPGSSPPQTDTSETGPGYPRLLLGAAYALAGRLDEAHTQVAIALRSPAEMDATLQGARRSAQSVSDPKRRAMELRLVDGMRLAGLRDHLDETADSQVPSDAKLRDLDQLNGPTPMTVPGGTTLVTEELERLLRDENPVLLTTAASNPTIPGAILYNGTAGGQTNNEWQLPLEALVSRLTAQDRHRPIVTFASSINRWHARNIALRLIALGYDHVYWYRGGAEAWTSHGLPLGPLIVPPAE